MEKLHYNATTDFGPLLFTAVQGISEYAIFLLDSTGHILTWNKGAQRIKGYSEKEILGKHFSIFYTAEDLARQHPQYELKVARKTGRFEEEGWRLKKDGTKFWANVLITALKDESGECVGFSKVTRDLTEKRRNEEALRLSEERFRQLVSGVKDYAIFMLTPDGIVATWNEGAERLKGYSADEIIGQHFSKFLPPEEIENGKFQYELEEASVTGRFEDEGWRVRKDGTRFWANVIITALRNQKNELIGYTKITRDLTERRRAEERLRRANEDLEKRVSKRTEELSTAKHLLEEAILARDNFLSIASHELKTPLTSLKLHAQMLKAKATKESQAGKSLQSVETIISQSNRLTRLIDDLLDVSRVQLGKFTFSFQNVNISEVLENAVKAWVEPLQMAGCEIAYSITPQVFGEIDSYRIEQVVVNLLSNVCKYAPNSSVNVSFEVQNSIAQLIVKDTGPGIDPAYHSKIFERYERASTPLTAGGLGLGLFISKVIAEAHHGDITVKSKLGEGSTFTVTFPLNIRSLS